MTARNDNVTVTYSMSKPSAMAIQSFANATGKKPGQALSDTVASGGLELCEYLSTYQPTPETVIEADTLTPSSMIGHALFNDEIKAVLGLPANSADDEALQAVYDLCGVQQTSRQQQECPFLATVQGIPVVTFEGTDGLYYSVGFAHPGLSSVAPSCAEALDSTKAKITELLAKRELSPTESAIARLMSKSLVIGNDYQPKDTILSISNSIGHAFTKYGCQPISDSATMLACQIVLALPEMSEANRSFARSHLARSTASTADIEAFVKSRQ